MTVIIKVCFSVLLQAVNLLAQLTPIQQRKKKSKLHQILTRNSNTNHCKFLINKILFVIWSVVGYRFFNSFLAFGIPSSYKELQSAGLEHNHHCLDSWNFFFSSQKICLNMQPWRSSASQRAANWLSSGLITKRFFESGVLEHFKHAGWQIPRTRTETQ